ncbi:MAG: extracellular solute-binding protein [Halobacteriales archaeon]|nr:extracellular solute-binding protein [Halobacteriales archaeon]
MTELGDGWYSRRRAIGGLLSMAGTSLAGCTGVLDPDRTDGDSTGGSRPPVSILAAGSLQLALSEGLAALVDVPLRIEAHGSTTVARLVADGNRTPDIVSLADTALFDTLLPASWYAVFASNAIVIAYNTDTDGGQRVAAAGQDAWFRSLLRDDISLGRTDPDQDPLGYRTLFMLDLASRYYDGVADLRSRLTSREQLYPETALLSQFETGAIDAAVVYRNMAVERDFDYIELPDEIDLSNPDFVEDWYSTVAYELPSGATVTGDLISYGATTRRLSQPIIDVFRAHVTGEYLTEYGFIVPDNFPRYPGDVPDSIPE